MNNTTTHIDLKERIEVCPQCHDTGVITIDTYNHHGEHTEYDVTCECQLADLMN